MQIRLKNESLGMKDFFFVALMILVFSAAGGFIYETIFYRIVWGYFVKRGTTFGPWIPVYGVGGLCMTVCVWRWQKNPFAIFFISFFVCGLLEFIVGYVLFHCFGGVRLWDYNTEPWNWGNIGGYICLRSVAIFGAFGFLLFYGVIPAILSIKNHLSRNAFRFLSGSLAFLFAGDITMHLILRGLSM